MPIPMVNQFSL